MRRRRGIVPLVIGGVLALGGAALTGCSSDSDEPAARASSAAPAAGAHSPGVPGAGAPASSPLVTGGPMLRIVDPYIPQPASPSVAGGFLIVQNDGDAPDRLVAASSPLSDDVQLHRTVEGRMEHLDAVEVPAGGRGVLARGGNHIMFMSPKQQLRKGDVVELTLTFERSGRVTVRVPVLGLSERPGDPGVPAGQTVATLAPGGTAGATGTTGAPASQAPAPSGGHDGHGGHGG